MLKIRRPLGRLIFNMGIAIPGKTVFLIETAPCVPADSSWSNCMHPVIHHMHAAYSRAADGANNQKLYSGPSGLHLYVHLCRGHISNLRPALIIHDYNHTFCGRQINNVKEYPWNTHTSDHNILFQRSQMCKIRHLQVCDCSFPSCLTFV